MAKVFNENKGYESIPRNLIFDTSLSDRARFVYCYMSAKPDGWDFVLAPMAKELGYSVETLRKYITELVDSGWIIKGEQQYDKDTGKFSNIDYIIKNMPSPCRKKPVSVKTHVGKNHTQDINSSINTPLNEDNIKEKGLSKAKPKKVCDILTPEEKEKEDNFRKTMRERYPRFMMMESPLTYKQSQELKKLYDDEEILQALEEIECWKLLLKKRVDGFRTIKNWINKNRERP